MRDRSFTLRRDWFIVAMWPAIGTVAVGIQIVSRVAQGRPPDWMRHLLAFVPWLGWMALVPLIILFARRFRIERGKNRAVAVTLHVVGWAIFAVTHSTITYAARFLLTGALTAENRTLSADLALRLPVHLTFDLLVYVSTLLVIYTVAFTRRHADDATETAQLEAALANAELELMTSQVQPAFILSTLHSIRGAIAGEPVLAEKLISRLSDLLRLSLENVGAEQVQLRNEVEFLRRFFEIEANRQKGGVVFHATGSDAALDAFIPNLLLQDLVLGWIHPLAEQASVDVRLDAEVDEPGSSDASTLRLTVRAATAAGSPHHPGAEVLERAGARLQRIARDEWDLRLSAGGDGVAVVLTLPYVPTEQKEDPAAKLPYAGGLVASRR